jgi:hypothetical protein
MADVQNEGLYMPYGSISQSAVAAGRNANATNTIREASLKLRDEGLEEVAARLEELAAALVVAQGQLGEAFEDVQDEAEDVAEELAREEPRKSRLTRLLKGIAEGARDVAGVVNAAHALADAVHRVL